MEYLIRLFAKAGRFFARTAVRFYYSPIVIQNPERIPAKGALLVTANHPNSLLDPVLIGLTVKRPVHFLAKAPLFSIPVFGRILKAFGMIPAYRKVDEAAEVKNNMASLGAGVDVLKRSDVLGIFPEGKSHDEPKVDQVKTGAARMAVDAYEKGMTRLAVLPIGLNYEQKDRFRSAVWVTIAEPIAMHEWMQNAPTDSRQAMRELNREIDRSLKQVVIHLEDPARLDLLRNLDSLLQDVQEPITGILRRKNIAEAINHFLREDPDQVEPLAAKVNAFSAKLQSLGLSADLPLFRKSNLGLFWQLFRDALWLLVWLFVALAGTLYYLIPFGIVRLLGLRLNSPGNMTTATTRLCLSLPHYLVWAVFTWFALRLYFLPWVAWTVTTVMPWAGIVALSYWPTLIRRTRGCFHQIRLLCNKEKTFALRQEYSLLKEELQALDQSFSQKQPGRRFQTPEALPAWWNLPRIASVTALLLAAVSTYVVFALPQGRPLKLEPGTAPALIQEPGPGFLTKLESDERSFLDLLEGLQSLRKRSAELEEGFKSGQRNFYKQEDNDAIRAQMLSYLNHRNALFRLIWRYQNAQQLGDPRLRGRAELLQYAAAAVLFESSTRFIDRFSGQPELIRKLNEAEPLWNVPPNLYDDIRRNLIHPENRTRLEQAWAYYLSRENDYKEMGLWTEAPYDQLHLSIRAAARNTTAFGNSLWPQGISLLRDIVQVGLRTKYEAGSMVSCWVGDTRIRAPREGKSLIRPEQLEELRGKLQPGDILLERRNWFLSNAFLPGYWPHAALYVGTPEQIEKLGIKDDPRVKKAWDCFLKSDAAGHRHVILESMSEGVVFSSLEHSVGGADSVAILRPRLQSYQSKEAIMRAFGHHGKPYDFDFDFFSTDRLVCTELVFRSYDGFLEFTLVDILGRKTLPALEIVRAFEKHRGEKKPLLEFIAFLDGDEGIGEAVFADEAALLGTLQRPALTWLQSLAKQ